jgi:hypothetical protein
MHEVGPGTPTFLCIFAPGLHHGLRYCICLVACLLAFKSLRVGLVVVSHLSAGGFISSLEDVRVWAEREK